jgi:hypothetical protein
MLFKSFPIPMIPADFPEVYHADRDTRFGGTRPESDNLWHENPFHIIYGNTRQSRLVCLDPFFHPHSEQVADICVRTLEFHMSLLLSNLIQLLPEMLQLSLFQKSFFNENLALH